MSKIEAASCITEIVMQPLLSDKIIFLFPSLLPYYRSIQTI